jgi:uncharacterized membrane protein
VKYLFYRFYRAALFIRKGGDPELRASSFLSIGLIINVYSIWQIYIFLFRQNETSISIPILVVIYLILAIIIYFLFHYKEKYLIIVDRFGRETQKERMKGIVIAYSYVIITVVLLFFAKHLQFS